MIRSTTVGEINRPNFCELHAQRAQLRPSAVQVFDRPACEAVDVEVLDTGLARKPRHPRDISHRRKLLPVGTPFHQPIYERMASGRGLRRATVGSGSLEACVAECT